MSLPNFKDKYDAESLVSHDIQGDSDIPHSVILCYDRELYKYITENHEHEKLELPIDLYALKETDGEIGFIGVEIGAPAAVVKLEILTAHGTNKFLSIGTAGSLQKDLKLGDLVICQKAIRDEGTSYHYIEPSKYAYPPKELTEEVEKVLNELGETYYKGTSWTIDAPYRETIPEVREYREEGVLTVEMEASALFAVAGYRNVDIACLFTISDHLKVEEEEWEPHFDETTAHLKKLFKIAIKVLTA